MYEYVTVKRRHRFEKQLNSFAECELTTFALRNVHLFDKLRVVGHNEINKNVVTSSRQSMTASRQTNGN